MPGMLGNQNNGSACYCCNDSLVPKRVNRRRERISWIRDIMAGDGDTALSSPERTTRELP